MAHIMIKHVLGYKANLNKCQEIKIVNNMFTENNSMELKLIAIRKIFTYLEIKQHTSK